MGLGSGIRKKPIPDPGSRGQKGTGSRIRIRNTVLSRASDRNPDWFRIQSGQWIRMQNPNPDPGRKNDPEK
jgi:hypothetical protein